MEMIIDFPGGAKVAAHFDSFTVQTDQPPHGGGEGSAPMPFDLFLSSIGTCAGIYVLGFCRKRNIPLEGIRIIERVHHNDATGMVDKIDLEIQVPPSFPKEYYSALVRSAELCKVKKTLEQPPQFEIVTREVEIA
ncbi:MAG TPA: OsmC family protein [Anaerolineales bacterium]|nr:OsmC family protein [Anaerolineales bacterium]